jgi:hypothetical protein
MWTRDEIADFTRKDDALGINHLGVCCAAGPHHIRAMAEALGRRPEASRYCADMSLHAFFGTDTKIKEIQRQDRDKRELQVGCSRSGHGGAESATTGLGDRKLPMSRLTPLESELLPNMVRSRFVQGVNGLAVHVLSTREANNDMHLPTRALHDFLRAYYHCKSGDWPGNRPFPLTAWSAPSWRNCQLTMSWIYGARCQRPSPLKCRRQSRSPHARGFLITNLRSTHMSTLAPAFRVD